ncbi:NADPH-dependent assimilatory sulfite reductase hemoprotein subunit [Ilyomonas limi]|uniref:assimilatory sulfite reductase (NADPH) n=2 Tax=Ilyomonas limi TaxID=2575867 RepID=A0A4U3L0N4_9BACT|nr:NADPH-dependent assimilatory sulfite reductase hemoprotein subunit [Ilyomonas limi]
MNESSTERIKKGSLGLRGTLKESMLDEHTGAIREDDQALVKFHGMYLQDDRDRREERAAKKLDRLYSFMIRLRLPGGFMTAEQWEMLHHIAGEHTTGTIKITTRQTIQLHGVLKNHVKPTLKAFNSVHLDSIAACGDVNRNVIATAHPNASPVHEEVFGYATKFSLLFKPKTRAFYEIWLDEEKLVETTEEDPLYQDRYLPRKFKIGIAIPPYNDIDVFANDLGLIAIIENGELVGFNLAPGGGMGATHGNPDTYPRLGTVLGYVDKADIEDVVYKIITVQRDFGNRSDRKLARLKYTMDRMGVDVFKEEVEKRIGFSLQPARPFHFKDRSDDYGWKQNHKGNWYYTAFIENGRVLDENNLFLKTAFLEITKARKANIRFTCNQNLIVSDVTEEDKPFVHQILDKYGVIAHTANASNARKQSVACVALNTCPLALAESQRYMPHLMTRIESLMDKHGIGEESIVIRMTGCPNGCARPYMAEIGFIGISYGHYNLMLGGDVEGMRLNKLYKENLDEEAIVSELDDLFGKYATGRMAGEPFGDFIVRTIFSVTG